MQTRRQLLRSIGLFSGSLFLAPYLKAGSDLLAHPHISCQQYPWFTFFRREGKEWKDVMKTSLQEMASMGLDGFEPLIAAPDEIDTLFPLLTQFQLSSHSIYVNSVLHEEQEAEKSIQAVVDMATSLKGKGVNIFVTNPSPIKWGGEATKTDAQLTLQAKALNTLGQKLRALGIKLAYHNHDMEMKNSAREFHHMMNATDKENVRLCLDAHWIYRGSGDSQVALFDIVSMYRDRIEELHLRQSQQGIWTEAFSEGDIDYERLAEDLLSHNINPHLVLEQAVEEKSPHTMDAIKAHQQSLSYARKVFADFVQ